jgi:hypothetical protein
MSTKRFNGGNPYHGLEVVKGKLHGSTDTDYFYFLCPKCGDDHILQILDFDVVKDGPVEYAKEQRHKAKRDFIIAFQLFCPNCKLVDFVKVANIGWQGGSYVTALYCSGQALWPGRKRGSRLRSHDNLDQAWRKRYVCKRHHELSDGHQHQQRWQQPRTFCNGWSRNL